MAAANLSDAEVFRLIDLWEKDSIQQHLEGAKRNKHVYGKIARKLQTTGSDKTSEQCRAKIKKLKADYGKIKDKHNQTAESRSNRKIFDSIDAMLKHRLTTRPVDVLDTSGQPEDEEGLDGSKEDEGSAEQSNNSSVVTEENSLQKSRASSSSIARSSSPLSKGKKKNAARMKKLRQS